MAKIAQLVEGNYNILDNIPVINQDLTASGFTPVANTYYRHTGATTDTFTQGVIYLYDTAYHKLGESGGGGTTLNKYVTQIDCTKNASRMIMYRILTKAKKISYIRNNSTNSPVSYAINNDDNLRYVYLDWMYQSQTKGFNEYSFMFNYDNSFLGDNYSRKVTINADGYTYYQNKTLNPESDLRFKIAYENDTEIT